MGLYKERGAPSIVVLGGRSQADPPTSSILRITTSSLPRIKPCSPCSRHLQVSFRDKEIPATFDFAGKFYIPQIFSKFVIRPGAAATLEEVPKNVLCYLSKLIQPAYLDYRLGCICNATTFVLILALTEFSENGWNYIQVTLEARKANLVNVRQQGKS